jgi:hypothetical protein
MFYGRLVRQVAPLAGVAGWLARLTNPNIPTDTASPVGLHRCYGLLARHGGCADPPGWVDLTDYKSQFSRPTLLGLSAGGPRCHNLPAPLPRPGFSADPFGLPDCSFRLTPRNRLADSDRPNSSPNSSELH